MKKCFGLLLLAACSSSSGSGTLTGNGAFTVTSQLAGASLVLGLPAASGGIELANVDPQPTCGDLIDGGSNFSGKAVVMTIFQADGGAVVAGTYGLADPGALPPTGSYAVLAIVLLGDGGLSALAIATSGSLVLTGVSSTWDGHFDSQLNNVADGGPFGTLSGTFSAPVCNH